MTASETRAMADYPLFDWLRIAMAVMVMAGHLDLLPWSNAPNLAVQVFFALSGWLIGTILIEMDPRQLPLFYFNRTTRVWIPYVAALILLYGVSVLKGPVGSRWGEFLAYDVTFTHNFFAFTPTFAQAIREMPLRGTGNHFWSIAVEEQFYLVSPLILLFAPGGRHPLLWLAAGLALLFVREEFSAIAFGVAAAAMNHRYPGFAARPPARMAMAAGLILPIPWLFGDLPTYLKVAPVFAISVVLLLARTGRRGKVGRFLGGISYPLYLNHWVAAFLVTALAKRLGGPWPVWGLAGMVLALAIGSAAYLLLDRQIMLRRRGWYSRALGWRLTALAYGLVSAGFVLGCWLHGNPFAAA